MPNHKVWRKVEFMFFKILSLWLGYKIIEIKDEWQAWILILTSQSILNFMARMSSLLWHQPASLTGITVYPAENTGFQYQPFPVESVHFRNLNCIEKSADKDTLSPHWPDKQTTDSVFSRNPDRIRISERIEIGRIQSYRHRKASFI